MAERRAVTDRTHGGGAGPLPPGAAGQPGAAPGGGRGARAAGRRRRAPAAAHRHLGGHLARTCATATVYLGSLDDDAAEALEERRPQLQRHVGRQVRMKRTPALPFAADPAVSAGARVEEVLRRLGRAGRRPDDGPTESAVPGSAPPSPVGPAGPTGLRAGGGGQGAGLDLPRRGGPLPPHLRPAPGRPRRHPRPRRHRRAPGRPRAGPPASCASSPPAQDLHGRGRPGHGHHHPRRLGRGRRDLGHAGRHVADARGGRRRPDRGHRAGPADGLGGQGRAASALHELAREGDGGRAGAPAGDRRPLRRRARSPSPGSLAVEVECSSGTYVGSLAADLGTALGGGAHLRNLRRTGRRVVHGRQARRLDQLGPHLAVPARRPGPARTSPR